MNHEMEHMQKLNLKIKEAEKKMEEARKRIPYHSIQPYLVQQIEDLEEELEELKKQLLQFQKMD